MGVGIHTVHTTIEDLEKAVNEVLENELKECDILDIFALQTDRTHGILIAIQYKR